MELAAMGTRVELLQQKVNRNAYMLNCLQEQQYVMNCMRELLQQQHQQQQQFNSWLEMYQQQYYQQPYQ